MEQFFFVFGLPGSGKSTAGRYILELAQKRDWIAQRFCDYDILYELYQLDMKREEGRFKPTEYDGFDVYKLDAFDDALRILSSKVLDWEEKPDNNNRLCIVEFARDDYCNALGFFDSELLPLIRDAYFLFVDADTPTCIKRIHARVAKPNAERTLDDHFVSNYIFDAYYRRDCRQYLESTASQLSERFHIQENHIHLITNTEETSLDIFEQKVEQAVSSIFKPAKED
jgi:hypothetical protein